MEGRGSRRNSSVVVHNYDDRETVDLIDSHLLDSVDAPLPKRKHSLSIDHCYSGTMGSNRRMSIGSNTDFSNKNKARYGRRMSEQCSMVSSILEHLQAGQSQRTEHGSQLISVAPRSSESLDHSSQGSRTPERSVTPQHSDDENDEYLSQENEARDNWLQEHPPQPAWEEDRTEEAASSAVSQEVSVKKSKSFLKKLSKGLFGRKKQKD